MLAVDMAKKLCNHRAQLKATHQRTAAAAAIEAIARPRAKIVNRENFTLLARRSSRNTVQPSSYNERQLRKSKATSGTTAAPAGPPGVRFT